MEYGNVLDFHSRRDAVDLAVGPVYATRMFRVEESTGVLRGLHYPQPVLDGVNVAVCGLHGWHHAPVEDCTCGFYVYATDRQWGSDQWWMAHAVVEVSGRVVICERGMKAERVEVVGISLNPCVNFALRNRIAQNYPHAMIFDSREDLIDTFPLSDLTEFGLAEKKGWVDRKKESWEGYWTAARVRQFRRVTIKTLLMVALATVAMPAFGLPLMLTLYCALLLGGAAAQGGLTRTFILTCLLVASLPVLQEVAQVSMYGGIDPSTSPMTWLSGRAEGSIIAGAPRDLSVRVGQFLHVATFAIGFQRGRAVVAHVAHFTSAPPLGTAMRSTEKRSTMPARTLCRPSVLPEGIEIEVFHNPRKTDNEDRSNNEGE